MLFDQLVESLRNSLAYAEDPTMQESRENALEQIKWARDAGDKKHVAVWQERLRAIETLAAESSSVTVARLVTRNLVLSLFPGADLLGRGFEAAGYTVLRGPDTLLGQDIRSFAWTAHASPEGVAGGSPCQDFSRRRRTAPTGYGRAMLKQFARVVTESQPEWWLLENVPGVPDVVIEGYHVQRFNLFAAECGVKQLRNRRFQFGSRDGLKIVLQRATMSQELLPAALASEDTNRRRRNFADVCELQGLPRSFDLPGLSRSAKFRAVGNGVPVPVAYAVACAIRDRQDRKSVV